MKWPSSWAMSISAVGQVSFAVLICERCRDDGWGAVLQARKGKSHSRFYTYNATVLHNMKKIAIAGGKLRTLSSISWIQKSIH